MVYNEFSGNDTRDVQFSQSGTSCASIIITETMTNNRYPVAARPHKFPSIGRVAAARRTGWLHLGRLPGGLAA